MTPELTCSECRQLLPWYIAGPLSSGERSALTHHLAQCMACQREAELWGTVSTALEDADRRIPPDTHEQGRWLALRSRLSERHLVAPAQTTEERLVDNRQINPEYPQHLQHPVPRSRPVSLASP